MSKSELCVQDLPSSFRSVPLMTVPHTNSFDLLLCQSRVHCKMIVMCLLMNSCLMTLMYLWSVCFRAFLQGSTLLIFYFTKESLQRESFSLLNLSIYSKIFFQTPSIRWSIPFSLRTCSETFADWTSGDTGWTTACNSAPFGPSSST